MPKLAKRSAESLFDLYYTHTRSRLLECAAAFDRFDRYDPEGVLQSDPRYVKLRKALDILADGKPERTERFLNLFSEEEI